MNKNLLEEYRKEISEIDKEIIALLDERFDLCWEVGGYKKENGMTILDENVEEKKLASIDFLASEDNAEFIKETFKTIMSQSRKLQEEM
ncbi:MAG: chorismate mutase [Lachnospiraceae bacterium]|nr:chorismate mutase [Lachnospiraceae bacterium]